MNQAVELRDIFNIIRKEMRLIFLLVFIMTFAGAAISLLLPKVYESKVDLLVNYSSAYDGEEGISTGEIESNLRLIETYWSSVNKVDTKN